MNVFREARRKFMPTWHDIWPEIVERAKREPTLHLGSGESPLEGAMTVDLNPSVRPTHVWNLNQTPWPFDDDTFDLVAALSIIEHLDDFLAVMGEIHRVCRHDAQVNILVPHFSSAAAFVDPTHKRYFSARSCDYFVRGTEIEREYGFYVPYRFKMERCYVDLAPGFRMIPGALWLARAHTALWENSFCYVLRGGGVFWRLRVEK